MILARAASRRPHGCGLYVPSLRTGLIPPAAGPAPLASEPWIRASAHGWQMRGLEAKDGLLLLGILRRAAGVSIVRISSLSPVLRPLRSAAAAAASRRIARVSQRGRGSCSTRMQLRACQDGLSAVVGNALAVPRDAGAHSDGVSGRRSHQRKISNIADVACIMEP